MVLTRESTRRDWIPVEVWAGPFTGYGFRIVGSCSLSSSRPSFHWLPSRLKTHPTPPSLSNAFLSFAYSLPLGCTSWVFHWWLVASDHRRRLRDRRSCGQKASQAIHGPSLSFWDLEGAMQPKLPRRLERPRPGLNQELSSLSSTLWWCLGMMSLGY